MRGETVVLVVRVTSRPARSTTIVAVPPPLPRIAACMASQSGTGLPLNDTIRSPGRNPAALAGDTGSVALQARCSSMLALVTAITHCETSSTVVVGVRTPWTMKTAAKSRKAMTRLVITPEPITTSFFHQVSL